MLPRRRVLLQEGLLDRRLPARPGPHAEQRVADAVPDDDLDPGASRVMRNSLPQSRPGTEWQYRGCSSSTVDRPAQLTAVQEAMRQWTS